MRSQLLSGIAPDKLALTTDILEQLQLLIENS
jgi:hypothetical protein